jgi:lipopolysaccharide biosynthesis regulator YciM
MSEEEIMKILKDKVELWDKQRPEYSFSEIVDEIDKENKAIQGLLDLYNKEKEKNASLQKEIKLMKSININDNYISKDKIREKINYYRKYCGYDGVTMIGNTQLKELEELLEE